MSWGFLFLLEALTGTMSCQHVRGFLGGLGTIFRLLVDPTVFENVKLDAA